MESSLSGRHAFVSGASQGIGKACAITLATLGANVTITARRADVLEGIVDALPRRGSQRHSYVVADSRDIAAVRSTIESVAREYPVNILINNSGGPSPGPVLNADADAFLVAYRMHVLASQARVVAAVPGMRAAGYGRIINLISTSVKQPIPGLGVSNTTRSAMAGPD